MHAHTLSRESASSSEQLQVPSKTERVQRCPTSCPHVQGPPMGTPTACCVFCRRRCRPGVSAALRAHSLHWGPLSATFWGFRQMDKDLRPRPHVLQSAVKALGMLRPGLGTPTPTFTAPSLVSPTMPCSRHHRTRSLSRRALSLSNGRFLRRCHRAARALSAE